MGEYQYYEFQAIDRALTREERDYLDTISSRSTATAYGISFVYHYSSLRADEMDLLAKYFDAYLYVSNFGLTTLAFRFPKSAINVALLQQYSHRYSIDVITRSPYVILKMELNEEDNFYGWIEDGEYTLSPLIEIRQDILNGDYRAPYLLWLKVAAMEAEYLEDDEDDEELYEPPVPANLSKSSRALETFIDYFAIDVDLVAAAAEASEKHTKPKLDVALLIPQLSDNEKNRYLTRIANGETSVVQLELIRQLKSMSGINDTPISETNGERRTISQILARSETLEQERIEREKQAAREKRNRELDKVAPKVDTLWDTIHTLIAEKRTKPYEEAVGHLVDLRDLAKRDGWSAEFQAKLDAIYADNPTLSGLHRRLKEKGLHKS